MTIQNRDVRNLPGFANFTRPTSWSFTKSVGWLARCLSIDGVNIPKRLRTFNLAVMGGIPPPKHRESRVATRRVKLRFSLFGKALPQWHAMDGELRDDTCIVGIEDQNQVLFFHRTSTNFLVCVKPGVDNR